MRTHATVRPSPMLGFHVGPVAAILLSPFLALWLCLAFGYYMLRAIVAPFVALVRWLHREWVAAEDPMHRVRL